MASGFETSLNNQVNALDFSTLTSLRRVSQENPAEGVEEVARQFEGVFMHILMKSMRSVSFGGGLFDTEQTQMMQDLLDQQLVSSLGKDDNGTGIAQLMIKELGEAPVSERAISPGDTTHAAVDSSGKATSLSELRRLPAAVELSVMRATLTRPQDATSSSNETGNDLIPNDTPSHQSVPVAADGVSHDESMQFVQQLMPLATQAAHSLGVDPKAIVAQAALETGWGRSVMQRADGTPSHNMFGIKADQRWQGERVEASALEYIDGRIVKRPYAFRAYDSISDSVNDYVSFLQQNPRYQSAISSGGDAQVFAQSLQEAGYATDPDYANKIMAILKSDRFKVANTSIQ